MEHPYRNLPDTAFWRRAVAGAPDGLVDPVSPLPFAIGPADAVATAGSCFAQHIARHLRDRGFRVLRTEAAPEGEDSEGYGLYAANYGNIYTVRHMLRLFEEAYGLFVPRATAWRRPDGRFVDPFRPRLVPEGFADEAGVAAARAAHLDAVRRVFEECDVLVLTLGLTEGWIDARDGAAFPLPPGVVAAPPEPGTCVFHDFTVDEVRADLTAFLEGLRDVNPAVRCVLTVSPVPLAATYTGAHVLAATTHAKAVLRVAAGEAARRLPGVAYFPSYEVVTGPHAAGHAFGPDLRSVAPATVARVMALFERHAMAATPAAPRPVPVAPVPVAPRPAAPRPIAPRPVPVRSAASIAEAEAAQDRLVNIVCDEEALDPDRA
jgi:hypothetical protein